MTSVDGGPAPVDAAARAAVRTDLGRNLFVEAGAGTGKTSALVGRIVALALEGVDGEPVPLSRIAAITFTEAAAAELRERIRAEFERELRKARADAAHGREALCVRALEDADIAAIATLHSFAQRLLSEFPVEIGIPPRVEVVDEVQSQIEFERRWSDFVDELFDDPAAEEFMVRAALLGAGIGNRQHHLRDLAQIFDDNWDRLEGVDLSDPPGVAIDFGPLERAIEALRPLADDCTDDADRLLAHLREADADFERFLTSDAPVERLRLAIGMAEFKAGNRGVASAWPDKPRVVAACERVGERAAELRQSATDGTLQALSRRVARFTLDAAEDRRREGRLEFHDLLVLASKLLRESPEARAALSARYQVLMLDEFQDTDPIQIELAMLLSGSVEGVYRGRWHDIEPDPARVFMVGDPKQSIYRFRRADIALFLEAAEKFSPGLVRLSTNFRTVEPILAAVNALFAELMAPVDGADRSQPTYEPLHAHRIGTTEADHRPLVFGGPADASAADLRQAEADDVARIVDDIRRRPHRWPVHDRRTGGWRPPDLSDITILLPTRTSLKQLTGALTALDIPYRADTGTLVYETQEVRDVLAVLSAVDDPTDQIALVAALRSPLYAIGDDDLYRFITAGGRFDITRPVPDAFAGSPIATAFASLRDLADRKWWLEPSQMLLAVIEDRGANVVALERDRTRDTWRRLRYLVDQARAFSEAGGGDLRSYLRWTSLQGVDGSKAHEPMLPEPDDIAVQIMTIHGAKGLEFPIAIVSGLTTQIQNRAGTGVSVGWGSPGEMPEVRLNRHTRTENFDVRADLEAQMDRPERDRLLYVALTRACDHLVVSAHHNPKLDKDGVPRGDSHGRTVHAFATGPHGHLLRFESGQGELFDGSLAAPTVAAGAASLARSADDWKRQRAELIERAARVAVRSATALARRSRDDGGDRSDADGDDEQPGESAQADTDLPPRTFRRGRAGTAIGRAVHGVLQLLDLSAPDDDDVARLVESQAWAESVPEHEATIARLVSSALDAPIVRACRTARHWKELYVAAPVGDVTVEGYVDLMVESDAGLVVVDYKTDSARTEAEVESKLAGYALQGAAYAVAVETATGRTVVDVQFVFTRPNGAIVRSAGDLGELREAVRRQAVLP